MAGNELWRDLTVDERALLDALMSMDFEGAGAFRSQVPAAKACRGCECGCGTLALDVDRAMATAGLAELRNPLRAEADVVDANGTIVGGVIVFQQDGWLSSIEVFTWQDVPLPLPRLDQVRLRLRELDS